MASENGPAEPYSISLHNILEYVAAHCIISSRNLVECCHALVQNLLHLALQTRVKALEQSRTARKHNILVQLDPVLDRTALNGIINDFTQRLHEILVHELWMEKHLWTKEALISNIDIDHVPINRLVNKFLELVRLNQLTCRFINGFLVV